MRNALITGGAGFIGSHLADLLIDSGVRVTVIDSLEPQVHNALPDYLNPRVKYYFDRVGSRRLDYATILRDIDTIYYLGSKVGPSQSMSDIADYVECNISNLGYFLDNLLRFGQSVKRIVLSASMGPYGEGKYQCNSCGIEFYPEGSRMTFEFPCPSCRQTANNAPLDESVRLSSISYYGLSKRVQEDMLSLYAQTNAVELVSLRYFSVFGTRQAFNNPYAGPIPIWIQNASEGKDLVVYEDGEQTRDFIHVRDITAINYLGGTRPLQRPIEIINCGAGRSVKIIDVAKQIQRLFNPGSRIVVTGTIRPGDLRHSLADHSRLKSVLGYKTFVSMEEGLKSFLDPRVEPDFRGYAQSREN